MVEEKDWSEAKSCVQATRCVWPHWVSEEVSFDSPFFSSCSSCLIPPVGGKSHADVKLLHFIWAHFLCSVLWLVELSLVIFYGLCFLSKLRFLLCFPLTVWTFFVRPVLLSIRRWIIMHDKKNTDKMTPFVHRSTSYHYHMCNGTPVRLASPWRFVWLTLIWHLIMLSVFLMNVRNATLFDQQRRDRPLKSHSPQ